jgi:hypothetical protein
MSIVAFYRVQCSGDCGRWLADIVDGRMMMTSARSNALVSETWEAADELAAKAGMHDGSQGQFAPEERKESPWLVPLCPRCRAQT